MDEPEARLHLWSFICCSRQFFKPLGKFHKDTVKKWEGLKNCQNPSPLTCLLMIGWSCSAALIWLAKAHMMTGFRMKQDYSCSDFAVSNASYSPRPLPFHCLLLTPDVFLFQLLDLRQVLARMLGLDVTSLAVPDYEIISRLEKLILANQANASTAIALDTAIGDMESGFRAGYEDASHAIAATRGRSPVRRPVTRSRAKSLSPTRRKDTRAYWDYVSHCQWLWYVVTGICYIFIVIAAGHWLIATLIPIHSS